jgi:AcrR family transcriptional regulator
MPKVSAGYADRRRQQILEAAFACFTRQGYHLTTIDDIVAEAGLSKGAIYGYFASKEKLFLALHDLRYGERMRHLRTTYHDRASVTQWLEQSAEAFLAMLRTQYAGLPRIGIEFWSQATHRPDIKRKFGQIYSAWHSLFATALAEGVRTGEFRRDIDVDAIAHAILTFGDGLSIHRAVYGHRLDPRKITQAFLSSMLDHIMSPGSKRNGKQPEPKKAIAVAGRSPHPNPGVPTPIRGANGRRARRRAPVGKVATGRTHPGE